MAQNYTNNPFVNYNYQKYPNLTTSNLAQSEAAKILAFRDRPNLNRNIAFLFPIAQATPNPGAGSPTLLAQTRTTVDELIPFAGRQI
jgi:hypothetical protein